ncbi:hypothetical protein DSC_01560 [Pseudoxanthomonas spadix BD-a59]|uniref:Uncharacterized protein n=1 Tax=Pseudoxanthomonas spadix (strain BD-a59) TaxID=1045855 RepID=G7UU76_PSEUP|nr:hypothetical protein DSC_01560 [Pseudoxanthomonas spadix BD-a59]
MAAALAAAIIAGQRGLGERRTAALQQKGTQQKGTEVITVSRKSYGLLRQCLIACAVCDEQAWIFLIVG